MTSIDRTHRFDNAADAYSSGRPGYPPELGAWLCEHGELGDTPRALELGAGTGELTGVLLDGGFDVVAIEPSAPMRAVLEARYPALEILDEPAEAMSAADGSFDLVIAANALHWFNPATAFPEIARVIGEHGTLAVIWNIGDTDDPLQAQLDRIRADLPDPPLFDWTDIGDAPSWDELFDLTAETTLPYEHRLPSAAIADLVASWSVVANMSEAEQRPIRERARALVPEGEISLRFKVMASIYCSRQHRFGGGEGIA